MLLSILIPTVPDRREKFNALRASIDSQLSASGSWMDVEVLHDPAPPQSQGGPSTGEKRDFLIMRARGEYVWMIDDDDAIYHYAIDEVLQGTKSGADVMAINGLYTEDGNNPRQWYIALDNPYEAQWVDGKEVYLRYPNHITPMKREHANKIRFPYVSNFEDKQWADALKASGLLKTQYVIEKPIYHYQFSHHNKLY